MFYLTSAGEAYLCVSKYTHTVSVCISTGANEKMTGALTSCSRHFFIGSRGYAHRDSGMYFDTHKYSRGLLLRDDGKDNSKQRCAKSFSDT